MSIESVCYWRLVNIGPWGNLRVSRKSVAAWWIDKDLQVSRFLPCENSMKYDTRPDSVRVSNDLNVDCDECKKVPSEKLSYLVGIRGVRITHPLLQFTSTDQCEITPTVPIIRFHDHQDPFSPRLKAPERKKWPLR